jgi:cytochrome c-type biogenesis protein CcmH
MMNRRVIFLAVPLVVALMLAFFAPPATTYAQEPDLTVNDVAEDLYCPLCSGLTVDVCQLEVCDDMKEVIAQKIAAGESEAAIQAYFIEQYGQKVVAKPSTSGFDLVAWILPFVAVGLAIIGLTLWIRSRATPPPQPIPVRAGDSAEEAYNAQLERELRRLEE